jgi:hypothetical protein
MTTAIREQIDRDLGFGSRLSEQIRARFLNREAASTSLTVGDRRSDMIKWALRRAIDKVEPDWNYDASYMRHMICASPRAGWLFPASPPLDSFGVTSPSRHGDVAVRTA